MGSKKRVPPGNSDSFVPWGHGPWGHGPWGHGPWGHGPWGHGPWGHGVRESEAGTGARAGSEPSAVHSRLSDLPAGAPGSVAYGPEARRNPRDAGASSGTRALLPWTPTTERCRKMERRLRVRLGSDSLALGIERSYDPFLVGEQQGRQADHARRPDGGHGHVRSVWRAPGSRSRPSTNPPTTPVAGVRTAEKDARGFSKNHAGRPRPTAADRGGPVFDPVPNSRQRVIVAAGSVRGNLYV